MADFTTGDTLVFPIGPTLDANGNAVTGATWTAVSAVKPDGTTFVPTYAEIDNGLYKATVTSDQAGLWLLHSQTTVSGVIYHDFASASVAAATALASDWTSARAAKLDQIGALSVTVTAPVASSGVIVIYQGDDYRARDSRALSFALTNAPDLTGATVTLLVKWPASSLSVAGSVATPGAATQTVSVDLTAAETALLAQSPTSYDLSAMLANGDAVTLQRGKVVVVGDLSA